MDIERHETSDARRRARERERRAGHRKGVRLAYAALIFIAAIASAAWALTNRSAHVRGAEGTRASRSFSAHPASRTATSGDGAVSSQSPSETATVSPSATPYGWASSWGLIAHGFGIIDGLTVTSTREAFETGYARGYRIFEVDLSLTKDSRIVGRHDWSAARFARYGQRAPAGGIPTLAEFSASLVKGRYHPVDADAIVDLMRRYPDAWVMTDLKIYSVSGRIRALKQLLSAAGGDQSIASRLIVQIYEEADVAPTRALGIKNLLYTFYRLTTPVSRALDFAKREGIKVITIPVAQASRSRVQDIKAHGLVCAAHTVNDPDQAASLRKRGVTLLYSDTLQP